LVAAEEVRAMLGVVGADQRASKGVITTTSDFATRIADDALIAPHLPSRLEPAFVGMAVGMASRAVWSLRRSDAAAVRVRLSSPGRRGGRRRRLGRVR